jgi:hypothetical protein
MFTFVLLAGCEREINLETIQWATIESVGNNNNIETEEIMIFKAEELESIQNYLSQIDWKPHIQPEMGRYEDIYLKLFVEVEQNMPERIDEYRIWFEQDHSMTILSTVENEGFGRMLAQYGEPFQQLLQTYGTDENGVE